jgi:hypothetical protein
MAGLFLLPQNALLSAQRPVLLCIAVLLAASDFLLLKKVR